MVNRPNFFGHNLFWSVLNVIPIAIVGPALPGVTNTLPVNLQPIMSVNSQNLLSFVDVIDSGKRIGVTTGIRIPESISNVEYSSELKTQKVAQSVVIPVPPLDPSKRDLPPLTPSTPIPQPSLKTPPSQSLSIVPLPPPDSSCSNPEGINIGATPTCITPTEFRFIRWNHSGDKLDMCNGDLLSQQEIDRWNLNDLNKANLTDDDIKSWEIDRVTLRDGSYVNRKLRLDTLVYIATKIAQKYEKGGYSTSGAIVCIPEKTKATGVGPIFIKIIEGRLTEIDVKLVQSEEDEKKNGRHTLSRPPLEAYIKSRLGLAASAPLNIKRLQEALQLLQLDGGPLFESVTARLSAGISPGDSILDVRVTPKERTFRTALSFDNNRVPSVGSLQRRVTLRESNLLGFGDSLSLDYSNSKGSNGWDVNYTVPISPRNTTLSFTHSQSRSAVIEPPFDDLNGDGKTGDIRSASQSYEISLRHPLFRRIISGNEQPGAGTRNSVFRELAVGVTGSFRESNTTLLDIPFPLSPGARDDGFTRIVALRFFQEFTQQDAKEILFLRSQFNFGLNTLGSTVNQPIVGLNEVVPDSRFFSWLGQAQWTRRIGNDAQKSPLFSLRATAQLADRPLLSSEQMSIGGFGSVRGYRQDILQADNGLFATAELQIPVMRFGIARKSELQVIPFLDYGMGWNSAGKSPRPNSLLSTGLGVQFRTDNFNARLDWGIPLKSVESRGSSWQDSGIHFSLRWDI